MKKNWLLREVLFWSSACAFLLCLMLIGRITPESHKGALIISACGLLTLGIMLRIARAGR